MLKLAILVLSIQGLLADHLTEKSEIPVPEKVTKLEPELVGVEETKLPAETIKVEEHHKFPFNFGFFKSQGPKIKEIREGSITLTPVPGRFAVFVTDSGHLVRLMEADPRPPVPSLPMPERKIQIARHHLPTHVPVEDSLVTGLTPNKSLQAELENAKRDGRTFWPFTYFYDPYYYNYGYGGGYGPDPYGYGYWRSNMRHA